MRQTQKQKTKQCSYYSVRDIVEALGLFVTCCSVYCNTELAIVAKA